MTSRFHTASLSIQEFTSIVDTFAQANAVASLVCGSIKIPFLISSLENPG